MPQRPYDTVKNDIEELGVKTEEGGKVKLDQCLKEAKETGSDLREGIEVTGDQRERWLKDSLYKLSQELSVYHLVEFVQNCSEQGYKLLLLGLRHAAFKVKQQLSQGIYEVLEDVCGLREAQIVAFLKQPSIHLYNLFLYLSHTAYCHEV